MPTKEEYARIKADPKRFADFQIRAGRAKKKAYAKLKADPERYAAYLSQRREYLKDHREHALAWRARNKNRMNQKYRLERQDLAKRGLCTVCYHTPLAHASKARCESCLQKNRIGWHKRHDRARH